MLFRKKLPKSCSYCSMGTELSDGTILCAIKGLMDPDKSCKKFNYDPTKRVPGKQKAPDFSQFDNDDFTL